MSGKSTPASLVESLLKATFALGVAAITYFSVLPSSAPSPVVNLDKVEHALAYGITCLAGLFAFPARPLLIGFFLFGWSGLMEVCQSFIPNRSCDFADMLANLTGIVLAALLLPLVRKARPVRPSSPSA